MVQKGNGPGQKLEEKQEGRGEDKEKGRRRNTEAGTENKPATTLGVAEEATTASAGNNRACSDGGCGENKCGSGKRNRRRTEWRGSS